MKILFLCNKSPYPPKEGGSLAMYNLITGLIKLNIEVKVLAVDTIKNPIVADKIPDTFKKQTRFESVFIDILPRWSGALKNIFTKKSYHIERFYNAHFDNKLKDILHRENFDIIQLESLYMTPYIPTIRSCSNGHIILRAHNVEHIIWKRIVANERQILKKVYLHIQSRRLEKYETAILSKIDGIAAITDIDAAFFEQKAPSVAVITIPFGIEKDAPLPIEESERDEKGIFFLGSMNWIPNIEGIEWFLEKVWPHVYKKDSKLKFFIAGRQAPPSIRTYQKNNVVFVGEVEDASAFMASKRIMVVPLFSGSGMRVKIIEGMMAGNAIISTAIGAEGIDYTINKNIFIADNDTDFAAAILQCVDSPNLCKEMGIEARKLIETKYLNSHIVKKLLAFYENLPMKSFSNLRTENI